MIAGLLEEALNRDDVLRFHPRLKDFYEIRADGGSRLLARSRSARILAIDALTDVTLKIGAPDGGIGPFVVDSLTDNNLRLHSFDGYFRGAPALRRLEFRPYRSQRAAWTGMMRDEVDAMYEASREALDFLEGASGLHVHTFLRPYVAGVVFNVSRPQLQHPTIRRALNAAVDRAEIVRTVYRGRARAANGPLSPDHWLFRDYRPRMASDRRLAVRLLADVPLMTEGSKMPARVRLRCLIPAFETQPFERIALVLQKQFYTVGVDLELEAVSFPSLVQRLTSGDFDAALMEFFGGAPTWLPLFWHSRTGRVPGLPTTKYAGADSELDMLDGSRNEDELRHAIEALHDKLNADPPAVFIAWPEVSRAVSRRFEVPVELGQDIMGANLRLWRPAKQQ